MENNDLSSNNEESNQSQTNEEINQTSNTDKEISKNFEQNQLTENPNSIAGKTNELEFKLSWQIRDKLISILNDYTALLYNNDDLDEKIVRRTNCLMYNLVDLPLKLDNIDKEIKSTVNSIKPTLVINSKLKTEITDLLIKNKNFAILFKDPIKKDVKSNLIEENNNLVIKLMQFPVQILKVEDQFDHSLVEQKSVDNESNQKEKITKYTDEINDLKAKISNLTNDKLESYKKTIEYEQELNKLKQEISNLKKPSNQNKQILLIYELKDVFDSNSQYRQKGFNFPSFKYLDLEWNLRIGYRGGDYLTCYLVLLSDLDSDKKCSVNCQLEVLNQ